MNYKMCRCGSDSAVLRSVVTVHPVLVSQLSVGVSPRAPTAVYNPQLYVMLSTSFVSYQRIVSVICKGSQHQQHHHSYDRASEVTIGSEDTSHYYQE